MRRAASRCASSIAHPTDYVTVAGGANVPPALVPALQTMTPVVVPQPVGTPDMPPPGGTAKPPAITPGNSTILFLQQPTSVNVGQTIPAVTVQVRDGSGAVLTGVNVTLSLGSNPGGAVLTGGGAVATNASGIATFGGLSLDKLGTGYTLLATVSIAGLTPATSAPFDVKGVVINVPATAGGLDNGNASNLPSDGTVPVNTGVFVPTGQSVTISGAGAISASDGGGPVSPDGLPGAAGPTDLAPALPGGALVARIGVNTPWQFVGSGPTTLTSTESGFLELAVGDSYHGDNSGSFTATVTRRRRERSSSRTRRQRSRIVACGDPAANAATGGPQGIAFNIPGASTHTIAVLSSLPALTNPTVIDATTQLGYAGAPVVALSGAAAPADSDGLVVNAADTTIRGLAIPQLPHDVVHGRPRDRDQRRLRAGGRATTSA